MLRVTHLSRRRAHCWDDVPADGLYIRFTGDQDDWTDLKSQLKSVGWDIARWVATYAWDDDKEGAWWIDEGFFNDTYRPRFANIRLSMLQSEDETIQWLYKGRRGWFGSHHARQEQEAPKTAPSLVPSWLLDDYRHLQLPEQAGVTSLEVKAAYRRLSKACHPDTGGSHDDFIKLGRAYEQVLAWIVRTEKIAV